MRRAHQSIVSARLLTEHGDVSAAISRAYYAIFHAARAALLSAGQAERAMGKTHSGLISAFAEYIVRPRLIDTETAKLLSKEHQRRLAADYLEGIDDPEWAREAVADAETFVRAVEALLKAAP